MVIPVIYIVCMVRQVLGKNHLYKTVVIDKLNSKKYQYMPCQINWTCCSTKIIATKGNNKIEITKHKTSICYMENPLKLRGKNYSTISEKFTIINWENTKMYQFEYTLKLCHHYNLEVEPQTTNPVVLSFSPGLHGFSLSYSLFSLGWNFDSLHFTWRNWQPWWVIYIALEKTKKFSLSSMLWGQRVLYIYMWVLSHQLVKETKGQISFFFSQKSAATSISCFQGLLLTWFLYNAN